MPAVEKSGDALRLAMVEPEADLVSDAKRLIDRIARRPRFAGSAAEAEARAFCAEQLRGAGFQITENEFQFSEWPGRWGVPAIGGWVLLGILAIASVSATFAPSTGLLAGVAVALPLIFIVRKRPGLTRTLPWMRSRAKNLEASRGSPNVWLVAHLDSKSQTAPMLLRVMSHVALLLVLGAAVLAGFLLRIGWIDAAPWRWIALAGCIAGSPSVFCLVRNASDGALDNASGVAAVILAARIVPEGHRVGILLTSGEELDLAGARAWTLRPGGKPLMLNCDTIDDSGAWRCMWGARSPTLVAAAQAAAHRLKLELRPGRVIPGILTDSLAFDSAGLPSVTISRGTLRTLARLHTAGDNSDRVTGAGAATAARLLAGMVEELS